jgi:hypothetical protein
MLPHPKPLRLQHQAPQNRNHALFMYVPNFFSDFQLLTFSSHRGYRNPGLQMLASCCTADASGRVRVCPNSTVARSGFAGFGIQYEFISSSLSQQYRHVHHAGARACDYGLSA